MALSWQTAFRTDFGKFTYRTARPIQAGIAFVLQSAALVLLWPVGRRMFRASSNDVSLTLKTFVAAWIVENLLTLPYALFTSVFWRPHEVELPYYWHTTEIVSFTLSMPTFLNISRLAYRIRTLLLVHYSNHCILFNFGQMRHAETRHKISDRSWENNMRFLLHFNASVRCFGALSLRLSLVHTGRRGKRPIRHYP